LLAGERAELRVGIIPIPDLENLGRQEHVGSRLEQPYSAADDGIRLDRTHTQAELILAESVLHESQLARVERTAFASPRMHREDQRPEFFLPVLRPARS